MKHAHFKQDHLTPDHLKPDRFTPDYRGGTEEHAILSLERMVALGTPSQALASRANSPAKKSHHYPTISPVMLSPGRFINTEA